MSPALGQALRWLQRVIRVVLALALVASLVLGVLAWRLAEGPMALPGPLARQIERAADSALAADGQAGRVAIGGASIAWEGWRGGSAAPLDIRLTDVILRGPEGQQRAAVPEAAVTLSIPALLRGRLAPATVELRRPSLLLYREADGSLSLEAAPPPGTPAETPAEPAGAGTGRQPLEAVLQDFMRPATGEDARTAHAALRRISIVDADAMVVDRILGRRWNLADTDLDLRRSEAGGLSADGRAILRSGGLSIPIRIAVTAAGAPMHISLGLALPALDPTALAALLPDLGPLAVLDAPVALSVTAEFGADAAMPRQMRARIHGGPGALVLGASRRLPFAVLDATVEAEQSGRRLRISGARLGLPGGAGAPSLSAEGEAELRDDTWTADLRLAFGAFAVDRLPLLWPEGVAAEARTAALAAAKSGMVREASLRLALSAPQQAPEAVALTTADARLRIEDAVVDLGTLAGTVAAPELALVATATPDLLRIDRLHLRLPGPPAPAAARPAAGAAPRAAPGFAPRVVTPPGPTPGPGLTATGEMRRVAAPVPAEGAPAPTPALNPAPAPAPAPAPTATTAGGWQGAMTLALDGPVRFADLPAAWPEGLRPNEREWITGNVTAGTLLRGQWRIEASLPDPADPATLAITALSGTAEAQDAIVHWLRPIPPVQVASATAEFSLQEIVLRARGGRQPVADAAPPGAGTAAGRNAAAPMLEVREATVRFFELEKPPGQAEISAQAAGGLAEVLTLLRHPRLKLFDKRKLPLTALGGQVEARVQVGFPLLEDLPVEDLRIRTTGRVTDGRIAEGLNGRGLERANLEVAADTDSLKITGQASLAEVALRLGVDMDFRSGPASQVTERATVSAARIDARQLAALGFDTGGILEAGTVALDARAERRRNGQGQIALRADLAAARLGLGGLGWSKPVGAAGTAEGTLRLDASGITALDPIRIDAAELLLRGSARFGPEVRLQQVTLTEGQLSGSRFTGTLGRPAREGAPWQVALRGPVLDLRKALASDGAEPAGAAHPGGRQGARQPPLALDLRFDRVVLGPRGALLGVAATARSDEQGVLREAHATGRTGPGHGAEAGAGGGGALSFALTPHGQERQLRLTAEDGGAFLEALDLTTAIRGGKLGVTASYADARPGAPLAGTAELDEFVVRDAPALGKLLQAMTVYGMLEALQGGGGLTFMRLVAPFTLTREALTLSDARAFSASLGLTAKGRLLRERKVLDLEGTVVPAYFFNQLLGNIPILGRLFSPERGGGLFAATYRIQGPVADPSVSVNPLAALTPGFLRGLFGLGEQGGGGAAGR